MSELPVRPSQYFMTRVSNPPQLSRTARMAVLRQHCYEYALRLIFDQLNVLIGICKRNMCGDCRMKSAMLSEVAQGKKRGREERIEKVQ